MRALAEFIMRGRWQALAVAVVGAGSLLFGWLSAAAIALVTLRKGVIDGSWLVLWALLPALLAAWMSGDIGSVVLLAGTFVLAVTLRVTVSLGLAILASVGLGLIGGAGLLLISGEFLDQLVLVFAELIGELEANMTGEGEAITLQRPTPVQVAGILAAGNAVTAVLSLLLARYWQALLYNPGGFRVEFHRLRLPVGATLIMGGFAIVLWCHPRRGRLLLDNWTGGRRTQRLRPPHGHCRSRKRTGTARCSSRGCRCRLPARY